MTEYFDDYFRWIRRTAKEIEFSSLCLENTIDELERDMKQLGIDNLTIFTYLNCKTKTTLLWNTDKDGVRICCPHCGTPHILTDMYKTGDE